MQCLRPIKAGFNRFGEIIYRNKSLDQSIESFAFPCRKCLPCRLNLAREKAIRCVHEAKMHPENMFLTLTYNNDSLPKDGKLHYEDFQKFIRKLRKITDNKIGYVVTGEYGDKTKRPHWHALIFNYRPNDAKYHYSSDSGGKVYRSATIDKLWGQGHAEFGQITIDSAGYVARYAAKKLTHGRDQDHQYHPIHKTSSKHAIGKRYLEKYWQDIFNLGYVMLPNYQKAAIPRYYQDWLKKEKPEQFIKYYTTLKDQAKKLAIDQKKKEHQEYIHEVNSQELRPLTKKETKLRILKSKFKQLQERLKL